jgi:hypothetical protein
MKALISTTESRQTGYRVAEVVADGATFPVAETMFWTNFSSNLDPALVSQDQYWYDQTDQTIKLIPQPEPPVEA